MRKLWVSFSLRLSLVLCLATIFPMVLLYVLSTSGFIEAYYQADSSDSATHDRVFLELLPQGESGRLPNERIDERLFVPTKTDSTAERPQADTARLPLSFDPEINGWRVTSDYSRLVVNLPDFHFRVELPARIAIIALPLISLFIGILLSIWMSRSVTRPFSNLAETAHAISNYDLSHRIQTNGSKEFQNLARSINNMAEKLEQAEVSRRNLMADVAHELRTPLAVLDGNLRAMLDGLHELTEEEIAILFEQTKHLNRLVDDLRELTLAEADQLSLNLAEIDLNRLINETAAHFELSGHEQGILLTTEVDSPLIHPRLDENRIRQVLHNLIANAFRFTPKGGNVMISAKRLPEKNAVEIQVKDTGTGISEEELPHIFNRFYNKMQRSNLMNEGTGLGLAIVKAIIELHGGSISVASAGRDQGCTFLIILPIKQP